MRLNKNIQHVISNFEQVIGYEFEDKSLIIEALTHSSYANENKKRKVCYNERLEFLGDSVLSIVISHYLFINEKKLPEGDLTKVRANIVCEESLNEVGQQINLGKFLLLGKGEEATGGRERTSIIADALEAIIAAVYLDSNIEVARNFVLRLMDQIIKDSIKGKIFRDYKTHLQELLQSKNGEKITYNLVNEVGPDHNKKFIIQVEIGTEVFGIGEGKSKKEAEQQAAKEAIKRIDEIEN